MADDQQNGTEQPPFDRRDISNLIERLDYDIRKALLPLLKSYLTAQNDGDGTKAQEEWNAIHETLKKYSDDRPDAAGDLQYILEQCKDLTYIVSEFSDGLASYDQQHQQQVQQLTTKRSVKRGTLVGGILAGLAVATIGGVFAGKALYDSPQAPEPAVAEAAEPAVEKPAPDNPIAAARAYLNERRGRGAYQIRAQEQHTVLSVYHSSLCDRTDENTLYTVTVNNDAVQPLNTLLLEQGGRRLNPHDVQTTCQNIAKLCGDPEKITLQEITSYEQRPHLSR